jgi:serine/threonine protein kinase
MAKLQQLSCFSHVNVIGKRQVPEVPSTLKVDRITKNLLASASREIRRKYQSTNTMLGKGAYGTVMMFIERATKTKHAVKIILKEMLSEQEKSFIKNEILIMSQLDHPAIIKYKECFEDDRYLFLVMEYIEEATDMAGLIKKRLNEIESDP